MDPSSHGDLPSWVQAGGTALFALAVWWELRQQRNERREAEKEINKILSTLTSAITALLERSRMNDTGPTRQLPKE